MKHVDEPVPVVHMREEEKCVVALPPLECLHKPRHLHRVLNRRDGNTVGMVGHVVQDTKGEQAHAGRATDKQLGARA